LWFLAPLWLIGSGVEGFDRGPDPRAAAMAHEAQMAAWMHNDNPIGRVLWPAARVERVWWEPGHCPSPGPGADGWLAAYRAQVRFYSFFAIPGPVLDVTCGGWSWAARR
jgi:hypothetical protein